MKAWVFHYHFKYALSKYANQTVYVKASNWVAAGAKADREVSKRKGIKGKHKISVFTRSCYPVQDSGAENDETIS